MMDADSLLPEPPKLSTPMTLETHPSEDLLATFVEEEVGRYDWENNWNTICAKEDPVNKVQNWLNQYQLTGDARWMVDRLHHMTKIHHGRRWK